MRASERLVLPCDLHGLSVRVDPFHAIPPGYVWVLFVGEAERTVDLERSEQVFDTAKDAVIDGWRALWARKVGRTR